MAIISNLKLKSSGLKVSSLVILYLTIALTSCDYINPDEDIPAYIAVDEFKLSTTTYYQGPNNHKINDVWISVNGDFLGVYELPAEFPVLHEGSSSIFINAGIKKNGIAASRVRYPFYTNVEIDTLLMANQTLHLSPKVKYLTETIFAWFENFEDPGISLDTTYLSDVSLRDSTVNGSRVGVVVLQGDLDDFQAKTINSFEFPEPSTPIYIELDYKCEQGFVVGLFISSPGGSVNQEVIQIRPKAEWNKIYIDLTYISSINYDANSFSIYLAASKSDTTERAEILFDNIKLLHF
jgi:hypothetical protein